MEAIREATRRKVLGVFVLDTSGVTDPRIRTALDASSLDEAILKLTDYIAKARIAFGVEVYVPPTVLDEMKRFLLANGVREETFRELVSWLKVKSPNKHNLRIPAAVISSYVEEVRRRITKGLRVAEDSVRKAYQVSPETSNTIDTIGALIRDLRERYREATRKGLLDSVEDLDAVLLAVELDAILVSNDEGVRRFAEALGTTVMDPVLFVNMLKNVREKLRSLLIESVET